MTEENKTPGEKVSEKIEEILLKKKKRKKKEKIISDSMTRFTDNDGYHYDEFVDKNNSLKFLKHKDGQIIEELPYVDIPDDEDPDTIYRIYPKEQINMKKIERLLKKGRKVEAIKFPPYPKPYGRPYDLFKEIQQYIHTYVELPEVDELLFSFYAFMASIFDEWDTDTFADIHISGPTGKGKSRLLMTFAEMTPYGLYVVDLPAAPLKRLADEYQAVICIDEKLYLDKDIIALLNGRFNKDAPYINANKEKQTGKDTLLSYNIFGPTILGSRIPYEERGIESRSFHVSMDFEMKRKREIPLSLRGLQRNKFKTWAEEIRAKLFQFRIDLIDKINTIEPMDSFFEPYVDKLEPRLQQILTTFNVLLAIMPEAIPEILKIIHNQIIRSVENDSKTLKGELAMAILEKLEDGEPGKDTDTYKIQGKEYEGVYLHSIYDEFDLSYRDLHKNLDELGFVIDRPFITKTVKTPNGPEEEKKRYRMIRKPDEEKLNELRLRYDVEYVKEILKEIEKNMGFSLNDQNSGPESETGRTSKTGSMETHTISKGIENFTQALENTNSIINESNKNETNKVQNRMGILKDLNENSNEKNSVYISHDSVLPVHPVSEPVKLFQVIDPNLKENLENTDPAFKNQFLGDLSGLIDLGIPIYKVYLNPSDSNTILVWIKGIYNQFTQAQKDYLTSKFKKIDLTANEMGIDEIMLFYPIPKKETLMERTQKWLKDHNIDSLLQAMYELDDHTLQIELKGPWDLYDPETQKELKAKFELVSYWGHTIVLRTRPQEVN